MHIVIPGGIGQHPVQDVAKRSPSEGHPRHYALQSFFGGHCEETQFPRVNDPQSKACVVIPNPGCV